MFEEPSFFSSFSFLENFLQFVPHRERFSTSAGYFWSNKRYLAVEAQAFSKNRARGCLQTHCRGSVVAGRTEDFRLPVELLAIHLGALPRVLQGCFPRFFLQKTMGPVSSSYFLSFSTGQQLHQSQAPKPSLFVGFAFQKPLKNQP